MTQPESDKQRI